MMINSITYSLFPLETYLNWNKSHFQKDFPFEMHNIVERNVIYWREIIRHARSLSHFIYIDELEGLKFEHLLK